MQLITSESLAKSAALRWKAQYYRDDEWIQAGDKQREYDRLIAAGDRITPAQVDEIVGNSYWSSQACDCCQRQSRMLVFFEDAETRKGVDAVRICDDCIDRSRQLMIAHHWADSQKREDVVAIAKIIQDFVSSSKLVNNGGGDWDGRVSVRLNESFEIAIPGFVVLLHPNDRVVMICLAVPPERIAFEWQNLDDAIDRISQRLIICLPQLQIGSTQIRNEREMITAKHTQSTLDRVDEFNAIDIKDTITNGIETRTIYHVSNSLIQPHREISFMRDDLLVSIDRDEYILKGWVKVPEEASCD